MVTRIGPSGKGMHVGGLLLGLLLLMASGVGHAFLLQPRAPQAASHRTCRSRTQLQVLRPFHPTAADPADAMPLIDQDRIKAHGRHICLDYTGFHVDAAAGAETTLQAIRAAVAESGVREVHSRIVVLGEDGLSPPGFTGVCLVDESHVTAHCYSDRGWLAIDVFTCGAHPPEDIARGVHSRLLAAVPGLHLVRGVTLDRFLHHDLAEREEDGVHGVQSGKQPKMMAGAAKQ